MELKLMERFFEDKKTTDKTRISSIESYRYDIVVFMRYMEQLKDKHEEIELINSITRLNAEDYIRQLKEKDAESTVNRKITSIKAYMDYLFETLEVTERNSFSRVKQIKKIKTKKKDSINKEQINSLIEATYIKGNRDCKFDLLSSRTRAIISICSTTGCRISELLNAKMSDLQIFHEYYKLSLIDEETKNHVFKDIIIFGKGKKYLDEYLKIREKYNQKSEFLMVNNQGGKLTGKLSNKALDKFIQRTQMENKPHVTNHCFRSFFRTTLEMNSVNINIIYKIGGWTLDKVSEAYVKEELITPKYIMEVCDII